MEVVSMILSQSSEYLRNDFAITNSVNNMPLIDFIEPRKLDSLPSPRLLVTHLYSDLIPKMFKGKIIYLSRNPKDVVVSNFNFVTRLIPPFMEDTWETFFQKFLKGEGEF